MSSWLYAYLLGTSAQPLRPENGLAALADTNLQCDPRDVGDLSARIANDEEVTFDCRNEDIFISCNFLRASGCPHFCFAGPRRIYSELPEENRMRLAAFVRRFASLSNTSYVIFVVDVGEQFTDLFVEIDGAMYFDEGCDKYYGYICELWVNTILAARLPIGMKWEKRDSLGEGYWRYLPG